MSLSFPQRMITVEPAINYHAKDVTLPRGTIVTMVGDDPVQDGGWYTVLCEAPDGNTYSLRYRDITEADPNPDLDARVKEAVEVIEQYGMIDGSHHKQWILSEVVRKLIGGEAFVAWLAEWDEPEEEDGEEYESEGWDLGIAP